MLTRVRKSYKKEIHKSDSEEISNLNSTFNKNTRKFKIKNFMDLKGKIDFIPDYDYKKMRENRQ
jgi:hypothetical protein